VTTDPDAAALPGEPDDAHDEMAMNTAATTRAPDGTTARIVRPPAGFDASQSPGVAPSWHRLQRDAFG